MITSYGHLLTHFGVAEVMSADVHSRASEPGMKRAGLTAASLTSLQEKKALIAVRFARKIAMRNVTRLAVRAIQQIPSSGRSDFNPSCAVRRGDHPDGSEGIRDFISSSVMVFFRTDLTPT